MRRCCLLLVCLLLLTGCGRADTQDVSSFAPAEGDRLVIFTSHKETIYEPILKEFEQRTGIWVELETGGTVTLLERIAAGESGADLMFGGGADSLSAYSACFAPYVSEYAGDVAPEYDLGGGIWTPFSALPVVLIYNTKLVRQNPPERWADLLDAGWRGRIAFADPTVSGSSCTFCKVEQKSRLADPWASTDDDELSPLEPLQNAIQFWEPRIDTGLFLR